MGTSSQLCAISKYPIRKGDKVVCLYLSENVISKKSPNTPLAIPNLLAQENSHSHYLVDSLLKEGTYDGFGGLDGEYEENSPNTLFLVHHYVYSKIGLLKNFIFDSDNGESIEPLLSISTKNLKEKIASKNNESHIAETAFFVNALKEIGVPLRFEPNSISQFGDTEIQNLKKLYERYEKIQETKLSSTLDTKALGICSLTGQAIGSGDTAYIIPLASSKPVFEISGYEMVCHNFNHIKQSGGVNRVFSMLSSPFEVLFTSQPTSLMPFYVKGERRSIDAPQYSALSKLNELGLSGSSEDLDFDSQKKIVDYFIDSDSKEKLKDLDRKYEKNYFLISSSAYHALLDDCKFYRDPKDVLKDEPLSALISILSNMKRLQFSCDMDPSEFVELFKTEVSCEEKIIKRLSRQAELLSIQGGVINHESAATILMSIFPSVLRHHQFKYSSLFRAFSDNETSQYLHKIIMTNTMDSLDTAFYKLTEDEFADWLSENISPLSVEIYRCEKIMEKLSSLGRCFFGAEKYKGSMPTSALFMVKSELVRNVADDLEY